MQKQMLNIKETAVYLGVSQDTVRRMIKDNQIAFLRVRGEYRIPIKNLEGWIERKTVPVRKAA